MRPVSNHTPHQPTPYLMPLAKNRNLFYMPRCIIRPMGWEDDRQAVIRKVPVVDIAIVDIDTVDGVIENN